MQDFEREGPLGYRAATKLPHFRDTVLVSWQIDNIIKIKCR